MSVTIPFDQELFFLGERKYVQAPNQLSFVLLSVKERLGLTDITGIKVKRYKQVSEVDSPVSLHDKNKELPNEDIKATFELEIDNNSYSFKLVKEPGKLARKPENNYSITNYTVYKEQLIATAVIKTSATFIDLLNEVVQMNKKLHTVCYNSEDKNYRFIVGGFENLKCFHPGKDKQIDIKVEIKRSWAHNDILYNQTKVNITQGNCSHDFLLPFIGQPFED